MQVPFQLPRLSALARHAIPHVLEGTLVPLALFYGALWVVGVWGALIATLAWSYGALLRRLVLRRRIPGLLVLGTAAITVRTISALATGSVFIYFLQPTLGTVVVALAFLLSVPAGRPLAERLAGDFVVLPPALAAHPVVRRLFLRITLLWAFTLLANAGVTLWLLISEPLHLFVLTRTLTSWVLTGGGIALSTVWFRLALRRHGWLGAAEAARGAA
ncbi:MAG: VC0807 family protein [Candidatus Velamenicoccus archaeovorus]